MFRVKCFLFSAVAIFSSISSAQNLISNGGFEQTVLPVGSNVKRFPNGKSIGKWNVVGCCDVRIVSSEYVSGGLTFPANEGSQWIDLTGSQKIPGTAVQQSVSTIPGNSYSVTFSVGSTSNGNGLTGGSSTVHALVDGVTAITATQFFGSTIMRWKTFSFVFTAVNTNTAIAFINGDRNGDMTNGLDAVSVTLIAAQ